MFWSAVMWGLGVSLGGSVGIMLFVVVFTAWMHLVSGARIRRTQEIAELSLKALDRRNHLTEKQISELSELSCAVQYATCQLASDKSRKSP